MTNLTKFLASTALALSLAAPAFADSADSQGESPEGIIDQMSNSAQVDDTNDTSPGAVPVDKTVDKEYGIVDTQNGNAVSEFKGSQGEQTVPKEFQYDRDKGIIDNQAQLMRDGAVTTSDDAAIGNITEIIPGAEYDTVIVSIAENLDTQVENFKVEVPKGVTKEGGVKLSWTLSELLKGLESQL